MARPGSSEKLGRVSCPLEHQNDTCTRGATSPRSASPIGPAPTREPRIALPPAMSTYLSGEASEDAETDDAGEPHQRDGDGDAVEVALGHRAAAERARHATAEHVRQAAALALVEQDEQR